MTNELKDIVNALSYYGDKGWEVLKAEKTESGLWNLSLKKMEEKSEETKEATDDNN